MVVRKEYYLCISDSTHKLQEDSSFYTCYHDAITEMLSGIHAEKKDLTLIESCTNYM